MKQRILLAGVAVCILRAAFGQTELIVNGGFELVSAGEWQITGAGAFITNGPGAANGSGYLSMGNVANAAQTAYQTIRFPTNLIGAIFSFNYATVSSDSFAIDDVL